MPGSWGRKIVGMLQGIGTVAASEEGLGSKGAVVPMMMMMMMMMV